MNGKVTKVVGIANSAGELPAISRALGNIQGERLLVVGDGSVAEAVPEGMPMRLLGEYTARDDVQKKAVLWADQWSEKSVLSSDSFKELLAYKDFSLWWFFLPVIFPDIMRCMQYIDLYQEVFTAENADVVVVGNSTSRPMLPFRLNRSFDLSTRIAYMVAKTRGMRIVTPPANAAAVWSFWSVFARRRLIDMVYKTLGCRVDQLLRMAISRAALFFVAQPVRDAEVGRKKLVLFSTPAYWRAGQKVDPSPGGEDAISGKIIDELTEEMGWRVVDVDVEVNVPSLKHYRRLWRKSRRSALRCMALECFYSGDVRSSAAKSQGRLNKIWHSLQRDEGFANSLNYEGVSLWPLIAPRFQYLFTDYAQIALLHIEAVDRVLAVEKPQVVLIEYEEGSYGRAAIVSAHRRGIASIALQHGLQGGAYVPAYYFRKIWRQNGNKFSGCPIPTKMAIFGETTRRYLTEDSCYPPTAVEITGTAIYDDALAFDAPAEVAAIRRQLGETDRGVVTVLSSFFIEVQDRRRFIEQVLIAVAKQRMQCVVKLHPHEEGGAWCETAERMGVVPPLLLRDQLWAAIAAADIVVSWYSSTIIDALLLARPVVVLRVAGKNNPENLAESGAIQIVSDGAELAAVLDRLWRDDEIKKEMMGHCRQLLHDHLYKCDGQARKRIAALIEKISNGEGVETSHRHSVAI